MSDRSYQLYAEVTDHCKKYNRTWNEEYQLIKEKKSLLSHAQRNYLTLYFTAKEPKP